MTFTYQQPSHDARLPDRLVRFGLWQRLEHWLLAVVFLSLVATGLPQKYNDADASVWVINALGGIDNARFLHRILACTFVGESLLHVAAIGVTVASRRFRPTMVVTFQDFRDAFNMLRYSLGMVPQRPEFDRYDYRQKFEYWGIVFGAVIMIVTGLTLWFPTYVTRLLPGQLVPAAKEMHSGEALLALLVIVIWHFYDVVFSPSVFPLDTGMITGVISRERRTKHVANTRASPRGFAAPYSQMRGIPPPGSPPAAGPTPDGSSSPEAPGRASSVKSPFAHDDSRGDRYGGRTRLLTVRASPVIGASIAGRAARLARQPPAGRFVVVRRWVLEGSPQRD
jgi:cytochrome b subunit of formate dehydrogenase